MAKNIEALTFQVSFFRGEEVQDVVMTINVNKDEYNDPKDAAIDHITSVWDLLQKDGFSGWLPKFKTFTVIHSRKLSDLGLS